MPVRNFCVARGQVALNTNTVIYTVPPGEVFILKQAGFRPTEIADWGLALRAWPAGQPGYVNITNPTLMPDEYYDWYGWWAMNAGDYLRLDVLNSGAAYWISGAVLPTSHPAP